MRFPILLLVVFFSLITTREARSDAVSGAREAEEILVDEEPEPTRAKPPPAAKPARERASFEARVLAGVASRRLRLSSKLRETERQYTLEDAPAGAIDLGYYPLANAKDWRRRVELLAGGELAHGVSAGFGGSKLRTQTWRWELGARLVLADVPELGVDLRIGRHVFDLEPDPRLGTLVSNVDYRYLRVGLDARIRIDGWFVSGRVGHRFVRSAGDFEQRVAELHVSANDVEVGLGSRLAESVTFFGAVRFTRYRLSSAGEYAGTDDYASLWLGLAFDR